MILFFLTDVAFAQLYFFGRNKVQYNEFNWKVLKTEHFDIYYYDDFEELAEIGAFYAEEAYSDLKVKFNNVVTNKIPLIFYNTHLHFQQTNTTPGFIPEGVGGFFEFLKGRVVIPYLGTLEGFRHVIRHELVHVFMMNKIFRVLTDRRISVDRMPPLWFTEGLAEYWSTTWDTQAEMVMRDAVINNYFVGIDNIYQIFGTFLMYKEGQNFLEFVGKTYGEEKVLMFLENFWMYDNFNKVIEYCIGKSIEDIDKEWLYYLKQKYYPMLGDKIPTGIGSEKLTDFGFNFSPSYYMKDGKPYVYFVANRDGYSSIYELEIGEDGTAKKNKPDIILRGEKEEVFEAFHLLDASLNVSKDGIMTFVTKSGATDVLHFYSIKEKKLIKTFQDEEIISITSPRWSPNGDKIVFYAIDNKGYSDIFVYNYIENSYIRITNDYYSDIDPVFGENDSIIVFASNRTTGAYKQKFNLFRYSFNSNSINYLTYANANINSPQFSPDKKSLYFISDYDGNQNVWRIDSIGNYYPSGMSRVTNFVTSVFDYTFIDTNKVIASGFENFSFQLYKIDLNSFSDSLKTFASFDFSLTCSRWYADKIKTGSEKEKYKYENKYTLDYAQSQVSTDPVFGTRGGALFSLSDLFGNDNYYFLIYNTAEIQSELLKSFNVAISRVNLGSRTNYAYGLFHFSGRRYDIRDSDEYFFERSFGGYFTMFYPLSKFDRLEANVSAANSDKQIITNIIERKALLVTNSISYVKDNSLWGPTGPLDGTRLRLLLSYTSDVKYSNVNYFTVIADFRKYFRTSLRSSLALRAAMFYNEGKEARRFFMGGSWDLRGWPRWSIRGEKLWLASAEYRFPLIDLFFLRFPMLDLGFPNIRGALFVDSGGAWDEGYEETLGSVGVGFRFNLFNVMTLRYDIGKKIENNYNKFQKGLFYQFFFGWDF